MMRKREDLTEELKDNVVRDYLRGDKTIIVQMEYKISPGVMYRILQARKVELRREDRKPEEIRAPAPTEEVGRFRAAMRELVPQSESWSTDETLSKMAEVLVEHLKQEPVATIKELGLGNGPFTVEDAIKAGCHVFVQECLDYYPEFERVGDDEWRLKVPVSQQIE